MYVLITSTMLTDIADASYIHCTYKKNNYNCKIVFLYTYLFKENKQYIFENFISSLPLPTKY